jgi:hypothetical protein
MRAEIVAEVIKQIRSYSDAEWELLVEEWGRGLKKKYADVKRFASGGDLGRDVVAFLDEQKFDGVWDNYQCKHLEKPLSPALACTEAAKVIYYSFMKRYFPPRRMYFMCPRDVSMELADLLGSPSKLRKYIIQHWNSGYSKAISKSTKIELVGDLKAWVEAFDYSIFTWYQTSEMIEDHRKTAHWMTRFGGLLPPPPDASAPAQVQPLESVYVGQLLGVYGELEGCSFADSAELSAHMQWQQDFDHQRERFFSTDAFNRTYRDETPEGTLERFLEDIHDSIEPIVKQAHASGFERMNKCLAQAAAVHAGGILSQHARPKIKQGACHHLVNEERFTWLAKK